jgi:hypothetical protein
MMARTFAASTSGCSDALSIVRGGDHEFIKCENCGSGEEIV